MWGFRWCLLRLPYWRRRNAAGPFGLVEPSIWPYGAIPIPRSVQEIGGPAHITVGIFVFSFLLFFSFFRVFDSTLVFFV
jgi:hypothetical protein